MKEAYTDGAVRLKNPGIASCAFVVYNEDGTKKYESGRVLDSKPHTNNEAEYSAVIDLLMWAEQNGQRNLKIHCDSKLVVEQTNQRWVCDKSELKPMMSLAYGLLVRGGHILVHIPGHSGVIGNERADALCNELLDQWMDGKSPNSLLKGWM